MEDYYANRIHHSCPVCLFNGLRQECLKALPDVSISSWTF